jgi:Fe-S-cluster containining protein
MITKNTPLKQVLDIGKECKRCGHCCQYGSGFLAGDDLKNISKFLGIKQEELKEKYLEEIEQFNTKRVRPKLIKKDKAYGVCVFFDNELGCKIQTVKPLQCRTGNCSTQGEELSIWFTLNYFVNKNDPESIRQFNAYLKSGGKILPEGSLKDFVPDEKQLKKILSYEVLK